MLRRLSAGLLGLLAIASLCSSASAAEPAYHLSDRLKGPDGGFDFVTFDPVLRRVYVSRSDGVTALDVDSGQVSGHLAAAQRSHEVLPVLGGTKLLVTDGGTNSALLLDAKTGAL